MLSSDEENFSCAIPHFAVWSRHRSRTPMIHSLLLLYAKNLAQFRVFPANPDKFPTVSFFSPQTSFSAQILHKFFACANVLLEFYEPHFLFKPVSSAIILTLNRRSFAITARTTSHFDHLLTRLVFQNEGRIQHFLDPL